MSHQADIERELDDLFRSYRAALPDPEPGALFTPRLWQKIEGQRAVAFSIRRWTQTLVAAAVALCVLMAVLLSSPRDPQVYSSTYVEVLSQQQPPEMLAFVDFEIPAGDVNTR